MNMTDRTGVKAVGCAMLLLSGSALAQDGAGDNAFADIDGRWYVSPMATLIEADGRRQTGDGSGWTAAIGKNVNRYFNFEAYAFQTDYDAPADGMPDGVFKGVGLAAYGFPFGRRAGGAGSLLGGAYGLLGVAYGETEDLPLRDGLYNSNGARFGVDAGLGYLVRIPFTRMVTLRLDARYRLDIDRHPFASVDSVNEGSDSENDDASFGDVVLSAGLLIPLGARKPPPVPPVPAVVPIAAACADGIDNDGDGRIDFPDDPGCTSADDDETDPPQ
jgi:hypothetical protein